MFAKRDVAISANACVLPVKSCRSVQVWVCVIEGTEYENIALLFHFLSLILSQYLSISLSLLSVSGGLLGGGVGGGGTCHNRDLGTLSSFN